MTICRIDDLKLAVVTLDFAVTFTLSNPCVFTIDCTIGPSRIWLCGYITYFWGAYCVIGCSVFPTCVRTVKERPISALNLCVRACVCVCVCSSMSHVHLKLQKWERKPLRISSICCLSPALEKCNPRRAKDYLAGASRFMARPIV